MNPKEPIRPGAPRGNPVAEVFKLIQVFLEQGGHADRLPEEISAVLANPMAHVDVPIRGSFANALLQPDPSKPAGLGIRSKGKTIRRRMRNGRGVRSTGLVPGSEKYFRPRNGLKPAPLRHNLILSIRKSPRGFLPIET